MWRVWIGVLFGVSAALLVTAGPALADNDDDDESTPQALVFQSVMIGLGEVPAVASTGRGVATYLVTGDNATLYYTLEVVDVSSPINAAHIHLGGPGQNGDVVANLCGAGGAPACAAQGVIAAGAITASSLVGPLAGHPLSDLIVAMTASAAYSNVHTANFPNGEIRGRVVLVAASEGNHDNDQGDNHDDHDDHDNHENHDGDDD